MLNTCGINAPAANGQALLDAPPFKALPRPAPLLLLTGPASAKPASVRQAG